VLWSVSIHNNNNNNNNNSNDNKRIKEMEEEVKPIAQFILELQLTTGTTSRTSSRETTSTTETAQKALSPKTSQRYTTLINTEKNSHGGKLRVGH
jgi:hypothetical protein